MNRWGGRALMSGTAQDAERVRQRRQPFGAWIAGDETEQA